MALTWDDLNIKNKTISISKSYDYTTGNIKDPKTPYSNRTIKINSHLIDLLNQLDHSNQYIFFKNGKPPTSAACNKMLKKHLKKYNIEKQGLHSHSLRHSQVAIMLNKGLDLFSVSKRLGHSNMSVITKNMLI